MKNYPGIHKYWHIHPSKMYADNVSLVSKTGTRKKKFMWVNWIKTLKHVDVRLLEKFPFMWIAFTTW